MNEQLPIQNTKPEPRIRYTVKEGVFAILSLVFGFIFVDFTLCAGSSSALGATLTVFAFIALTVAYMIVSGIKPNVRSIVCGLILAATGSSFLIFGTRGLSTDIFIFDMMLGLYWLFTTLGGSTAEKLDYLAWFDALKALFILPLSCFGHTFTAPFGGFSRKNRVESEKKNKNRTWLYILIGIAIATIPCAIVLSQLSNDEAFKSVLDNLFSWKWLEKWDFNFGEFIAKLLLAIPMGCLTFGALFGATRRPRKSILTYEGTHKAAKAVRFIPLIITCTVFIPLLVIYLLYFFSQMTYFISAFSNILPEGFTYAEYARSGFFELCKVSVVNLVVIAIAEIFSRRADRKPAALKSVITILSVFTLALMVIAESKVTMYIRTYGMTPDRITAFWSTLLIGVLFVFIIIYQFAPKINFTRCAAVAFAALLIALVFADTDSMIARYNIDMYLNGQTETLDTDTLTWELSDSAVPVIIEKYDLLPEGKAKDEITKHFTRRAGSDYGAPKTWKEFSFAANRAEKLIVEKFGKK